MTEAVVALEQQSEEWRQWRLGKIGASDVPVILGQSPYKSLVELWMEKLRLPIPRTSSKAPNSYALDRGNRWEPRIRAIHELQVGLEFKPEIVVHPEYDFMMASLDGRDRDADVTAEYKTAGAEVMEMAKRGICHPKYYGQVQMQLECTKAKEAHFFAAEIAKDRTRQEYIKDTALVIVKPDPAFIKNMLFECIGFWYFVTKKIRPPLTEKDFMICDDQTTVLLFSRLKEAQAELEKLKKREDALVDKLTDLSDKVKAAQENLDIIKEDAIDYAEQVLRHPKIHAIGVSMVKYKRGGWKFFVNKSGEALGE